MATSEPIEPGYQTFVSDGGEEFGAVREVWSSSLVVYVEKVDPSMSRHRSSRDATA